VNGLGKDRASIECGLISPWRRAVCGDLTSAFDFRTPNSDWPASVPKTAAYQKVSGKPHPTPPAVQSLPLQETSGADSGARVSCALPYQLQVQGSNVGDQQFELNFTNEGRAGAAFIVYSKARSDGPWYYTVEAGKSITGERWNWTGTHYELSVHGANGFLRQFRGAVAQTADAARPELQTSYHIANNRIFLTLSNLAGQQACSFTIVDNAYGAAPASYSVPAGQTKAIDCGLDASFGWYDFSVSSSADPQWLRRVAGHLETGSFSRTDPQIGRNRGKQVLAGRAAG